MSQTAEFRGCDNLCIAEVTADNVSAYTTGTVVHLCEVAQIAKTTEQSSETHFYDNKAAIEIKAIGADNVQLIVPALVLSALAKITGASIDAQTGAYIDRGAKNDNKTYALGYRLKLTDGTYRYVWKLKGKFTGVPDETSDTESNSINTNNQTVQFTSLDTAHEFTNGGSARSVYCDERDGLADLSVSSWFAAVKTPDALPTAKSAVTALSITPATKSATVGTDYTYTLSITPSGVQPYWASSNPAVVSVDQNGNATPLAVGTAVITATAGNYTGSSIVTVSA